MLRTRPRALIAVPDRGHAIGIYLGVPLLFLLALLQVTLMPHLTAAHVQPDLMLAAVVCWALFRGPAEGSLAGFIAGIAMDFLSGAPFGVHTVVMVIVGIAAGLGAAVVPSEHSMLLPSVALFCTVIQQALYVFFLRAAGWPLAWPEVLMPVVIPSALLNLLLTALLYPLVARYRRQVAPEEPNW